MNTPSNSPQNPENQFGKNIENELQEARQLLKKIEEIGGIGHWEVDLEKGKNTWSDQLFNLARLNPDTTEPSLELGRSLLHPEDWNLVFEAYTRSLHSGNPTKIEIRIICPNGELRYILAEGRIEKNEKGTSIMLLGIFRDITHEKKIERELIDRNKFIESTLENIPLGIAVNQISTGKATYINPAFIEIYGWPQEILTDVNTFIEKIHPNAEYRDYITRIITEDTQSGDSEKMKWMDIPISTHSGEQRIISAKNIVLPDQDLMISTVINETDRYWTEHSLKISNERFLLATQAVSDAIWDWDIQANSIFWGTGYARLFGYPSSMQNVSEDFLAEKIHPDDFESIWSSILEARQNPNVEKWNGEYRFQKFDGTYAFVKENTVIIRDSEGHPIRMVGALQDITKEKEAQNALLKKTSLIETTASIIQSLLELSDWQLLLEGSLKLMGETVDADRTYFFKNYKDPNSGRLFSRQMREWTNGKVSSEIENPAYQSFPLDEHPEFLKSVYQRKPFEVFTSDCVGSEKTILEEQKIKSILQIPLFVENQFYGYIGFDDCTRSRVWNEDEKNFLKSVTTNLAFAIERKQKIKHRKP